jgi:PHD/YefM family antitoxin component YafN of YafNO toxin-antitoxin module
MKTVSVTEFRGNIKRYLDIAEQEKLVIHRSKGPSFIVIPLNQEEDDFLLNENQKKAIDVAKKSVLQGKTYSNNEALEILKNKHPKYFK